MEPSIFPLRPFSFLWYVAFFSLYYVIRILLSLNITGFCCSFNSALKLQNRRITVAIYADCGSAGYSPHFLSFSLIVQKFMYIQDFKLLSSSMTNWVWSWMYSHECFITSFPVNLEKVSQNLNSLSFWQGLVVELKFYLNLACKFCPSAKVKRLHCHFTYHYIPLTRSASDAFG